MPVEAEAEARPAASPSAREAYSREAMVLDCPGSRVDRPCIAHRTLTPMIPMAHPSE